MVCYYSKTSDFIASCLFGQSSRTFKDLVELAKFHNLDLKSYPEHSSAGADWEKRVGIIPSNSPPQKSQNNHHQLIMDQQDGPHNKGGLNWMMGCKSYAFAGILIKFCCWGSSDKSLPQVPRATLSHVDMIRKLMEKCMALLIFLILCP